MKGTEKIIAHIQADAQAQADDILARAAAQCEEIRAGYEAKAQELYDSKLRAGAKDCGDRAESLKRLAEMEGRKGLLAAKQEMIAASFAKAQEMLVSLPEEPYRSLLKKLAVDAAVTGKEEIVLNSRDRERCGEAVVKAVNEALGEKGQMTLSADTGDFAGGLILRRENIQVNCTAELLVELCRGDMAATLAGVLFE